MYCGNCGRPVRGNFCGGCGTRVERPAQPGTLSATAGTSSSVALPPPVPPTAVPLPSRRFGEMIRLTWDLYRQNFRLFAGAAAMVSALQALELLYVPSHLPPAATLVVFVALWPVIVGVVSQAVASAYEGHPAASVQEVYESLGKVTLFVLVIANVLLVIINAVGLLFLLVPGIYLWIRFQFVPQAIVLERVGLLRAFSRSSELVRGSWWRVFGIDLAVFGSVTVVNIIAFAALSAITSALHYTTVSAGIVLLIGMTAVWAIMDPMVFGVLLLLYYDLRDHRSASPSVAQYARSV